MFNKKHIASFALAAVIAVSVINAMPVMASMSGGANVYSALDISEVEDNKIDQFLNELKIIADDESYSYEKWSADLPYAYITHEIDCGGFVTRGLVNCGILPDDHVTYFQGNPGLDDGYTGNRPYTDYGFVKDTFNDISQLEPGDIIFWSNSEKGIYHVGVYTGEYKISDNPGETGPQYDVPLYNAESVINTGFYYRYIQKNKVIYKTNGNLEVFDESKDLYENEIFENENTVSQDVVYGTNASGIKNHEDALWQSFEMKANEEDSENEYSTQLVSVIAKDYNGEDKHYDAGDYIPTDALSYIEVNRDLCFREVRKVYPLNKVKEKILRIDAGEDKTAEENLSENYITGNDPFGKYNEKNIIPDIWTDSEGNTFNVGTSYSCSVIDTEGFRLSGWTHAAVAEGSDVQPVFNAWVKYGGKYDTEETRAATLNEKYLVAATSKYGKVGDWVTFFFEDGSSMECILFDEKWNGDSTYTEWGHKTGSSINVLEFEIVYDGRTNDYQTEYVNNLPCGVGKNNLRTCGWINHGRAEELQTGIS